MSGKTRLRILPVLALILSTIGTTFAGAGLLAPAAGAAPPSGYVPKSALINGDSVTTIDGITDGSGHAISLEQFAAEKAGFTVTVADGPTWSAMTKADFAKYQVLIVGDPFCSATPASVLGNAPTWAPVVMGTSGLNSAVGNRALVGTDPEWHYANGGGGAAPTNPSDPTTAGSEHLIQDGIAYAGGVDGATGVYFDTSCADPGQDTATLNSLSASGSGFTEDNSPPCGGSVQLIASNPVFNSLKDTDIQGWGCSDHITFPTYPTDWQPLAVATDTATKPTCGIDPDTGGTACGEAYVLVAGEGIVVAAPDLSLTPTTDTAPAGGSHTVTAKVSQSGTPLAGVTVAFEVTGQNAGVAGTCVPASCATDATGSVTFTYDDANGAGTDTINASATISGSTEHATSSMTWTPVVGNHPPVATPQSVTTPQDTPVGVTLAGTDADADPLTFAVATGPAHGTLSGSGANLTYTPNPGYSGPDSFTFTANDGHDTSAPATVSITVTPVSSCGTTAPTLDVGVSANIGVGSKSLTSPKLTTSGGNELILAFIEADGPYAPNQSVSSVTGGGLTWTRAVISNATWGTTEVWQAYATVPLTNVNVTAGLTKVGYDGAITVAAFKGAASHVGATVAAAALKGTPKATLTPHGCHSLVWAAGHDWTRAVPPTPVSGQTLVNTFLDHRVDDSFWTQEVDAPTADPPAPVTVQTNGPSKDRWTMAVVEIPAAS